MHKSVDLSDVLGGGKVSSINYCGFTVDREPLYRMYRGHRAPDIPVIQNQKNYVIRSIQNLNFIAYSEAPLQERDVPPVQNFISCLDHGLPEERRLSGRQKGPTIQKRRFADRAVFIRG